MIPRAHITAWRSKAPWSTDAQVEQDLVISRVIVELFSDELLAREVAFRGGTALHKLHFDPPSRYSEDVDLVQVNAGLDIHDGRSSGGHQGNWRIGARSAPAAHEGEGIPRRSR